MRPNGKSKHIFKPLKRAIISIKFILISISLLKILGFRQLLGNSFLSRHTYEEIWKQKDRAPTPASLSLKFLRKCYHLRATGTSRTHAF